MARSAKKKITCVMFLGRVQPTSGLVYALTRVGAEEQSILELATSEDMTDLSHMSAMFKLSQHLFSFSLCYYVAPYWTF